MGSSDHPLKDYYSEIHTSYDRVNRIFTFGRDSAWRKKAAVECVRNHPVSFLDICTGTGDFIFEVARRTGTDTVLHGYDFSAPMLQEARKKYERLKKKEDLPKVVFVEGDVADMPFDSNRFDAIGITFGIRNLIYENSNSSRHLDEIFRVLRPGGRLVVLESCRPSNRLWRFINSIYLRMILPYLGWAFSGNLNAYRYLARSSRNYHSLKEMGRILGSAGFISISGAHMFLGSVMMVVAEKN